MMLTNGKDSRWLQLEVCREFQRQRCTRNDNDCKFAHPNDNVEFVDGKVIACYDSIKERCNRETCKYFHPPAHLKEQLLINGRNNLVLKNAILQHMQIPLAQNNPTYLANFPTTAVAALTATPTVQTPSTQLQQQSHTQQLSTQQLVNQQQLALLAAYGAAAYGQAASAANVVAAASNATLVPSLSDLQAYSLISLPSAQNTVAAATTNLLNSAAASPSSIINSVNLNNSATASGHLMSASTLMRSYISPGTTSVNNTLMANTKKPNTNIVYLNRATGNIKLEICREYLRCACKRSETECKYAHPPAHINKIQDGCAVVVCSNFQKGRCTRDQCRFFHPPPHLMEQIKQQQLANQQHQLLTHQQMHQRTAMMLSNQSLVNVNSPNYTNLRKKRPRETDDLLLSFPRLVPLSKRPALDKVLLPTTTYDQAIALQHSFVPFSIPGHCVPRF